MLIEAQNSKLVSLQSSLNSSNERIQKNRRDIDTTEASVDSLKKQSERLELKSLTTERFALVSENGKELITMKSYPGRTFMMLKGQDGPNSIFFNVHDDGRKSISFRDGEAKAQIGIKTEESGMPEITVWRGGEYILRGNEGNHEVIKISEVEGRPEISFYDSVCNGQKIWTTNDWWLNDTSVAETRQNQTGDDNSE